MSLLSRDEILKYARPRFKEVDVEGMGRICVRQITAREQQSYLEIRNSEDFKQRKTALWWVIAQAVYDRPDGARLFSDQDVEAIGELEAESVAAIFLAIMRFSEADPGAVDRAGEPSAETKNSGS